MPAAEVNAESVRTPAWDWPLIVAVWLSLLVYGAIAAPIPAVNEPHYLTKARHFWQPEWCANDFFLASPNAHTVFFATTGWLTQWLSFEQTAWVGRTVTMLVLAVGWVSVVSTLLPRRASPLLACWVFLAFQSCGNLSGEWLVGGIEGKVFAYGLLFAALGQLLRGDFPSRTRSVSEDVIENDSTRKEAASWLTRWIASSLTLRVGVEGRSPARVVRAGALAGLAIAFHPVVGAWGVLAFAGATWMKCAFDDRRENTDSSKPDAPVKNVRHPNLRWRVRLQRALDRRWPFALLLLALLALPGLIPVVQLLLEPASGETKRAATYIQVYYRLAHHLDPMLFPLRAYVSYVALLLLWLIGLRRESRSEARRLFDRVVAWSVVFALAGLLVGAGTRPAATMPWFMERAALLKFYPFRLADVLVPLAVSVLAVGWWEREMAGDAIGDRGLCAANDADSGGLCPPLRRTNAGLTPKRCLCAALFVLALVRAHSVVETNRYSGELRADWIAACQWIDGHLPHDAVVQAPHNGWAFKWFARRAEYVAFKDCPQDAAGIVEWNRRLIFLKKWYEDQYVDQFYSAEELRGFRLATGITHLLTDRLGPLELEPVYRNATFQVYDLSSLD